MAVRQPPVSPPSGRQRGVALVTALLVVALAATLSADMMADQQLAIRRTQNLVAADQAQVYALAAEAFARDLLARDDGDVDHPGEDWAQPFPALPFEGAVISLRIFDLQARLNLNDLVLGAAGENPGPDGDAPRPGGDEAENRRAAPLGRLLAQVHPEYTTGIEQALRDWVDDDQEVTFPEGAEDDFYTRSDPPYRPANRPLLGASELRLVKGVDAETFDAVREFVTALPEGSGVNVNTASPQVLASLSGQVDESAAREAVEGRPDDGYADVQEFLDTNPAFAVPDLDPGRLAVSSRYFLVRAEVTLDRARAVQYSLLERAAEGAPRVVYRGGAWP